MRSPAAPSVLLLVVLHHACTPLESERDVTPLDAGGTAGAAAGAPALDGGSSAGGEGAQGGAGGEGGDDGSASCPDPETRPSARLAEDSELTIAEDTVWTCQRDYELVGNVIVAPGARLTIDAGTRLRFAEDTLLLVQRGATIEARGSAEAPITFTSTKAVGERSPGDYRGLILIGKGPSHSTSVPVHDSLSDARAHYGGGPTGDTDDSCGTLRYVRIEFAGGSIDDPSLPAGALTLAGCGAKTVVDHVQVHRATDGVGLLGGNATLSHVLVTNNSLGEAIEWSAGFTGTLQFIVAQSLGASAAMQGSNSSEDPEARPVARPVIYNASLLGRAPLVTGQHFGLLLQHGSHVVLKNSLIQGFADAALDLRLDAPLLATELGEGKAIDISHVLMHDNARPYTPRAEGLAAMVSMRLQDPGLPAGANPTVTMPEALPVFAPSDPTVNTQPAATPPGFDGTAGFRGGVAQDGLDWTLGWTSYPND